MSQPLVAIVGRPNVGKSTLFNRIIGRRAAIVEELPGVTRDRKEEMADWRGREFRLVDTGGWTPGGEVLDKKVSAQAEKAMEDADVVLFVVDGTTGITEEDALVARKLQRMEIPTLLVVNKIDGQTREHLQWDFTSLGLSSIHGVSSLHGRLVGDLLDEVLSYFPEAEELDDPLLEIEEGIPGVAIVGRPNVGKSTLFNRMIGEDRSVVHDMPGTTRDVVD
ncbi:MAG: GTPase, partial [Acidimicrobiales bacterium]